MSSAWFRRAAFAGPRRAGATLRQVRGRLRIRRVYGTRASLQRQEASVRELLGAVPTAGAAAVLRWPIAGAVTSRFGEREKRMHRGVDVAAPAGATVTAPGDGRVVHAGPLGAYGITVAIDHGGGLVTLCAHHRRVTVTPGQHVRQGDAIGEVGSTGRANGPHLHFEVRRDGEAVDPIVALPPC